MTIGEMKDFLARHPELTDDTNIEIAVRVNTDRYPKAYVRASFSYPATIVGDAVKTVRVDAHLPQGMSTVQRKAN